MIDLDVRCTICNRKLSPEKKDGYIELHCLKNCNLEYNSGKSYYTYVAYYEDKENIYCLEYSFPFFYKEIIYRLKGKACIQTVLASIFDKVDNQNFEKWLLNLNYIDIPLNDQTHIQAEKLFRKLHMLIPFK